MKNEDVELIRRVLAGDDDAFSVLVRKYQKQVHALAWQKIGDFHIAEEITQDTFLKAYKQLTTLKEPQRFVGWLYVIAANRCSSWLRKKRLWTQSLEHLEQADKEQLEKAAYSEFVVEENERISGQAQRDIVKKLLAKLEESERTVMTLHYFGEMSCTEIGAFLGVSANTIKSRLRRAQQRLQKEESMIREALDNFKISPNLTDTIMHEISRAKPATPSSNKPLIPWAIAASTLVVVLLMLGFGNHQYLTRFQKPYNFDATSVMTVDIVDAPIVANLESKPDVRTQIGSANALDKRNNPEQQSNDAPAAIAEAQGDEIAEDWTKWELPKEAKARLGKGGINVMQFSPDGTLLAVGSNIGVWLYDAKTGKEISLFPGACQSLAFSPDGRFLANGGGGDVGGSGRYHGKEVQLWEVSTGKRVPFAKSPSAASALLFSEDGKTLISLGDWGDTIGDLNIETGEMNLKTFRERPKDRAYSESYALTHDKLAVGGVSGKIQLWDPISGKKLPIPRGHSGQFEQGDVQEEMSFEMGKNDHILGLAFSPDGSQLAIGSENATVLLWDTTGNNEPIILRKHTGQANTLVSVVSVRILAFSPNGKMLASGDTDKTVQLWDTGTGKLLATLTGHINGITALTFSPDGSTLASASADGAVLFWNTETNNPLPIRISDHPHTQRGMAILKDSNTLASVAYNGIITFWDLKTQRKSNLQTRWHCDLSSLAFSPDGKKLAIAHQQQIHFTDVRTGREIARLTGTMDRTTSAMAVSPDGKTVALGSSGKIRLWNTDTGKILYMSLKDMSLPTITTMIFSRDGKKLVSGDLKGGVQIWDAETGEELTNYLLTGDGIGNVIDLLGDGIDEPMDNGIHFIFPKNLITALAFSADESLLAVGNFEQIRLFGSKEKTHFKEVFKVNCNALVFSPDETGLIVGLLSGRIQLLDITTGDELATLDGHTAPIVKLLFSSDGKTLVSTGYDGTILLWDWDEVLKGSESVGE